MTDLYDEDGEENLFSWSDFHARPSDPDTSHQAANSTSFRAPKNKRKILRVLASRGPMTSDEVMHVLGADYHQRFSDLANIDLMISDSGLRRPSDRDCSMIVWEINDRGRRKLAEGLSLEIE